MAKPIKTADIIASMKKAMSTSKPLTHKPLEKLAMKPAHRERDMRQEAMDMGSHGAKEYFGDKTE